MTVVRWKECRQKNPNKHSASRIACEWLIALGRENVGSGFGFEAPHTCTRRYRA
ncbi:exported hypothetical protein [Anopheles sinensis]|uniref:Uncharacterized protein n=1 Tax=Anopheles sinensis TaxID=74873 RepID=A0A084VGZ1_ANOSI|nr:exported hypothetical protein [Anopheles sinensis]